MGFYNAIVKSWIMQNVSRDLLSGVLFQSSAYAIWSDLKERFDMDLFTRRVKEIGKEEEGLYVLHSQRRNKNTTRSLVMVAHRNEAELSPNSSHAAHCQYPIGEFIQYTGLSASYQAYITQLSSEVEPSSYHGAAKDIKYTSSGEVERYKARLVAKGYSQKEGLDYQETFSPVVKMVTVRSVVSIAATRGWTLNQMDVYNAFLQGDLEEEVYITLSQGFSPGQGKTQVCRLLKSLYGLKQASRQ
uniref:Uncharacterized protein LOC104218140 n=1 Tax=Nicotiana sylvestris TaxID=4096 RepID=A0A1U7VXY5_NICSY|nr:PREDICTED: uncharacterized protein LOC104218140 [Nicotiana sylvestris]